MRQRSSEVDTKVEDFTLNDEAGNSISLYSILSRRKGVVIFVYPKANTPGCTTQACGFRDVHRQLDREGYDVLGMSRDKKTSQKNWKVKHALPYPLLCEADLVLKSLGCFDGTQTTRSVFVIASDGKFLLRRIKVSPIESVSEALRVITGGVQPSSTSQTKAASADDDIDMTPIVASPPTAVENVNIECQPSTQDRKRAIRSPQDATSNSRPPRQAAARGSNKSAAPATALGEVPPAGAARAAPQSAKRAGDAAPVPPIATPPPTAATKERRKLGSTREDLEKSTAASSSKRSASSVTHANAQGRRKNKTDIEMSRPSNLVMSEASGEKENLEDGPTPRGRRGESKAKREVREKVEEAKTIKAPRAISARACRRVDSGSAPAVGRAEETAPPRRAKGQQAKVAPADHVLEV